MSAMHGGASLLSERVLLSQERRLEHRWLERAQERRSLRWLETAEVGPADHGLDAL